MEVLLAGRIEADHFRSIALGFQHQVFRDHALADNSLVVIDVVEEQVQRLNALNQTGLHRRPLFASHRPRNEVERENLLHAAPIRVDREGDALVDEHQVRAGAALLKLARQQLPQPFKQTIMRLRLASRAE